VTSGNWNAPCFLGRVYFRVIRNAATFSRTNGLLSVKAAAVVVQHADLVCVRSLVSRAAWPCSRRALCASI